jgi:hypothetical protein
MVALRTVTAAMVEKDAGGVVQHQFTVKTPYLFDPTTPLPNVDALQRLYGMCYNTRSEDRFHQIADILGRLPAGMNPRLDDMGRGKKAIFDRNSSSGPTTPGFKGFGQPRYIVISV